MGLQLLSRKLSKVLTIAVSMKKDISKKILMN
jgi:hypothetical protein